MANLVTPTAIDVNGIRLVYSCIAPHIRRTPIVAARGEDFGLGSFPLTLKLEHLQHAGAFKTRGAFANLLLRQPGPEGVAAASGGNHGAAVAYAARSLGVKATIFVPTVSSPAKIARIRSYGATLVVGGDLYGEALAACEAFVSARDVLSVHAFDQAETILGQGTLALELSEQAPDADTVLVAVGGGGLVAGIATWYAGSKTNVIGTEPESAPTLTTALAAGKPVDARAGGIAADSLAPRRVGELVYPIARDHLSRVLLVRDEDIYDAQVALWETLRIVVEPGGAAAFAALLSRRYEPAPGERVAVVVSGANTDAVAFRRPA